jgi:LysR family transcriptional regulator, transcriptional activator for aaeXAB operon
MMKPMTSLITQLDVLSRAIFYKNLSAASAHVGLSQPQLSRIVQRLEEDLGMQLLDRTVRRKSAWTCEARELAELHTQNQRRLEQSVRLLQTRGHATVIHMGTLEGLIETANDCVHAIFEKTQVAHVFLDVFDTNEMDAKFLAGDLDLILTSHLPSKAKPKFSKLFGFQSLDWTRSNNEFCVQSPYEFGRSKRRKAHAPAKTLVSNSLLTRKLWLKEYGGQGQIPSPVEAKGGRGMEDVLLLANDALDPRVWAVLA